VRRLKKHIFEKMIYVTVGVLFIVKLVAKPVVGGDAAADTGQPSEPTDTVAPAPDTVSPPPTQVVMRHDTIHASLAAPLDFGFRHPLRGVHSYADCFPDVQDTHYVAATAHGVRPVLNREEAEHRKTELVYIGSSPFYDIDPAMRSSIPYLVPRASLLLHDIGRRFMDSLAVKGIPLHTIIVTSVLRTEEDVAALRRINHNASEQSCHRFGTTFDISYNRYHTMTPPDEEQRRAVRNDTLKYVLSEVLRDMRDAGRCYVKHEVKQGCFHITTR